MKTKIMVSFLLLSLHLTAQDFSDPGARLPVNLNLQLGTSAGFGKAISGMLLIPNPAIDLNVGKFGVRAFGEYFKTTPEFDMNGYLNPIINQVTLSGVKEKNSNLTMGIAPYLSLGQKALSLQAGVGLKYLIQNSATARAVYTLNPGVVMLNYPEGESERNLFLLEPNLRVVYGKPEKVLRLYLNAGYNLPLGKTQFDYTTRGDLTKFIDPKSGLLIYKALDASVPVKETGSSISSFLNLGAGIGINLSSLLCPNRPCAPDSDKGRKGEDEPNKQDTVYKPPVATHPANNTIIKDAETMNPVVFRWTPVMPPPKKQIRYTLRIYEVKESQVAHEIVSTSKPIFETAVKNDTRFELASISQLNADPGSSFAWTVQAVDMRGNPVGTNNGTSGVMVFKIIVQESTVGLFEMDTTLYKVECNGFDSEGNPKYKLTDLILKNIGTNPGNTGLHFGAVTDYISPTGFSISNLNPPFATGILPNSSINISFEISDATSPIYFVVKSTIPHPENPEVYTDKTFGLTLDLPPCICNDCDTVSIEIVNKDYHKVDNYTYDLTGMLQLNVPIFGVEFQVVSWKYEALPTSCSSGVNMLEQSAMLLLPATTVGGYVTEACDTSIAGNNVNAVKCVRYLTTTPLTDPSFKLTVGLPGALPGLPLDCCTIRYMVCIKATLFLDAQHCNYCSVFYCYEFNNQ